MLIQFLGFWRHIGSVLEPVDRLIIIIYDLDLVRKYFYAEKKGEKCFLNIGNCCIIFGKQYLSSAINGTCGQLRAIIMNKETFMDSHLDLYPKRKIIK